jgi:hypothetical protein
MGCSRTLSASRRAGDVHVHHLERRFRCPDPWRPRNDAAETKTGAFTPVEFQDHIHAGRNGMSFASGDKNRLPCASAPLNSMAQVSPSGQGSGRRARAYMLSVIKDARL